MLLLNVTSRFHIFQMHDGIIFGNSFPIKCNGYILSFLYNYIIPFNVWKKCRAGRRCSGQYRWEEKLPPLAGTPVDVLCHYSVFTSSCLVPSLFFYYAAFNEVLFLIRAFYYSLLQKDIWNSSFLISHSHSCAVLFGFVGLFILRTWGFFWTPFTVWMFTFFSPTTNSWRMWEIGSSCSALGCRLPAAPSSTQQNSFRNQKRPRNCCFSANCPFLTGTNICLNSMEIRCTY